MKKILDIAYNELNKLEEVQNPSWETYEHLACLITTINYFESNIKIANDTELNSVIEGLKENFGYSKTLDILATSVVDFQKDIDCFNPHLTQCLIKRIKENM